MSMELLDSGEDPNAESHGDIDMNQISTMTLDEFRKLLYKELSVPSVGSVSQNGTSSQNSDSPKSQSSESTSRSRVSSRTSSNTSSWRSMREKTRSVCQSIESKVGSRVSRSSSSNDSGYLSQNGETHKRSLPSRPKTPTSAARPKTPVSSDTSESRCKTPTNSTNSFQRPKTPVHSNVTTPSSVDESKVFNLPEGRPSTPVFSERPSTPSLIPRPHSIPRPSTPTAQAGDNDKPLGAQRGERRIIARPTTPNAARKQLPSRPASTVPQEKSYSSIFQARRAITPGPVPAESRNTKFTPRGDKTKNVRGVISRPSAVSRSIDFSLSERSQSVTDVRLSLSRTATDISLSDEETDSATKDERTRSRSRTDKSADRTRRASDAEPGKLVRQGASEECLVVTRTDRGAHGITVTANGSTKYNSNEKTNRFVRSASSESCDTGRSRQRAKTPDPSMIRNVMVRRKSEIAIGSSKCVESRTEAWVNSTVNDNKRKLPPRPKRAMTPNSMNRKELELTSRPFEEIKEALRMPLQNGVKVNPDKLDVPPEDPKAYIQMEKLFQMLKAKELRESVNNTVSTPKQNVFSDNRDSGSSQGILKGQDSKGASSRSLNSVRFSNSSLSSLSSGNSKSVSSNTTPNRCNSHESSPLNHSLSLTSFTSPPNGHTLTSKPQNGLSSSLDAGLESGEEDEETFGNTAESLLSKLKEMAKLRPRKDGSGPKSRIPAPRLDKNRKSKSFSNLSTCFTCDRPDKLQRNISETADDSVVFYNPEDDEVSAMSRMSTDRDELSDRSETPVPRMATPLTTGRSTFLSTSRDKSARLVRAVSQDRSRSNSMSSLSSLSLSNAENENEFL